MEYYLISQMVQWLNFNSMFDELKEVKYFEEKKDFKSLIM